MLGEAAGAEGDNGAGEVEGEREGVDVVPEVGGCVVVGGGRVCCRHRH